MVGERNVWRDWPVAEASAVFVGVLGIDLLAAGHVDPIKAMTLAAACGLGAAVARRLLGAKIRDSGTSPDRR